MEFINKKIEEYVQNHSEQEPALLSQLNRETWLKVMNPRMLSGHIQGRVLSLFSKMINPNVIIEIGTYTGYSALCLAEGLKNKGKIYTIDNNEEHIHFAKKYFNISEYKDQIIQYHGNAINILPEINQNAQLVFIDADKENYCNYYNLIIEKIDIGGYIIADNVLWSGKVTEEEKDLETKSLDKYNKLINLDKRVENILLPIRDGLMICRKISN